MHGDCHIHFPQTNYYEATTQVQTLRCKNSIRVYLYEIKYSPHQRAFQIQAFVIMCLFILGKVSCFYVEPSLTKLDTFQTKATCHWR